MTHLTPDETETNVNELYASTVEAVIDALEPLGFESVVVCASGAEPCASLNLGGGAWLDVIVQYRGADE